MILHMNASRKRNNGFPKLDRWRCSNEKMNKVSDSNMEKDKGIKESDRGESAYSSLNVYCFMVH